MKNTHFHHCLMAALATLSIVAHAENQPQQAVDSAQNKVPEYNLKTVTIIGNRINNIDNTLPNVDVINPNKLRNPAVSNLKNAVAQNPAVAVSSSAGSGQASQLFIRGLGQNYTELTLDGQEMPSFFAFGPYTSGGRDFIETDTIKQVDIIKGLVSPKQKTGALAGTVNMESYSPSDFVDADKPYHFAIKPGYTSKNRGFSTTLTAAGYSTKGIDGMLMYTHRRYHELENQGDDATRTRRNHQDLTSHNILAKGGYHFGQGNVSLTLEHFERDYTTNARYPNPKRPSKATQQPTKRDRLALKTELVQVAGLDKLKAEISTNHFHQVTVDYGTTTHKQTDFGMRVDGEKSLHLGTMTNNLLFGASFGRTDYDYVFTTGRNKDGSNAYGRYLPLTTKNKFIAYFKDNMVFGNGFNISPGLRIEHHRFSATVDDLYRTNPALTAQAGYIPNGHTTSISPSINAAMPFGNYFKVFASYAHGEKQPDAANIGGFDHGFGYIIPNPNLKVEKSHNYELGMSYVLPEQFEAKLTTFYSQFKDFIDYQNDGTFGTFMGRPKRILRPFNITKVKTYGAELELGYHFNEQWYAHAALAWMKGQVGDSQSHDVVLNQAYPKKAILGVNYNHHNRFGGEINWTLVGKGQKPEDPTKNFQTPGYGVLDLTGWWRPVKNLSFNAGIYNVLDKKYWLSSDVNGLRLSSRGKAVNFDRYTEPGRNYAVSLQYQF